jgi:AcrR family transcriptional regulator
MRLSLPGYPLERGLQLPKRALPKAVASPPPPQRKQRRPTARRTRRSPDDLLNRIFQAATDEFKRSGYTGTTTAAIARKADVTEAQLFRYFGSKSNLFRETIFKPIDQHFLNFVKEHPPQQGQGINAREMTTLYTTELQRFISEHSEMLTSLFVAQTYESGDPQVAGAINSLQSYFDHGASMMRARIKGKPKVNPDLLVRVTFATVLASIMFRSWIFPRTLASDQEITAAVNDFVMDGIGANSRK